MRHKSKFFYALFVLGLMTQSREAWSFPLTTFTDMVNHLETHPFSELESFITQIDPEIRKRFQLVYESRSPNRSSLQYPRIVLTNRDASLLIGISGDASLPRGNVIEIIEASPETDVLSFRELTFIPGGKVQINLQPDRCINCHGNPKSTFIHSPMRPIWDGYPNWPGVLGSSHNNNLMGTGKYGSGKVPTLEFEENALFALQTKAWLPVSRYSALIGLPEISIAELSAFSSEFTEGLIRRQLKNLLGIYQLRLSEIFSQDPLFYTQIQEETSRWFELQELPSRFKTGYYEELTQKLEGGIDWFVHDEKERGQALILKYGTAKDLKYLEQMNAMTVSGAWNLPIYGSSESHLDLAIPLLIAGVDPSSFSITRELGTYMMSVTRVGDPRAFWIKAIKAIIQNPEKPLLISSVRTCTLMLTPSRMDPLDAVLEEWLNANL